MKQTILRSKLFAAMALSISMTANASEILDYVPGDTAFFMGTTTPLPMVDVAAGMPNYKDVLEEMFAEGEMNLDSEMQKAESPGMRLYLAGVQGYINFVNDPLTTLSDYGIQEPMEFALYMTGVTPVMRIKLDDPKRFDQAMEKFDTKHSLAVEKGELGGIYYRRYKGLHGKKEGGLKSDLLVAVQKNTAVITLDFNNEQVLARALGYELPAVSLAATGQMDAINRKWDYSGEMSFFLDFKSMLSQYASANGSIRQDLAALIPGDTLDQWFGGANSPGCMDEMSLLTDVVPRIVGGYRKIEQSGGMLHMVNHMALEVNHPELMSALTMLRGHISPDVVNTDSVIGFGMGLDVEQIMPAMQQIGVIMEDVNPQCEYLADAAQGAKASVQNMTMSAAMMSGMVPGFKGFSVAIYDAAVDMAQKVSSNPFNLSAWDALVLISSDQPEMLLQSAQMFPPLAGINIPADGSEISLRDPIEASTGMPTDVSAAQRGNHIALFQGQQARDVAQRVGAADAGKNGLMYFRVNLRKYMGLIYESMAMMMGTQGAVSEEDQQKFARFLELYPEGTGDFALDVTAAGIEGISYTTLSVRNQ